VISQIVLHFEFDLEDLNSYRRLRRLKVTILLVASFGEFVAFKSYFM
jgi:hypothetical protein